MDGPLGIMGWAAVHPAPDGVGVVPAENLTLPAGDIQPTRKLVATFLQHLSRQYAQCVKAACPPHLHPIAQQTIPILRSLGQEGMFGLIRRPQVHVFVCCALREIRANNKPAASASVEKLLFQTLFELAMDQALPADGVRWPGPSPMPVTVSPTHCAHYDFSRREEGLLFTNDGLRNGGIILSPVSANAEAEQAFHPVEKAKQLALMDTNPLSDFEAHPEKDGNQVSLGQTPTKQWVESLVNALGVIGEHLPLLKEEMDLILQQFVPVGYDPERHLSASYMESIGTVYLTLHPRAITMTEAVIHEFQHNKINMLFHIDPVLHNAYAPLFTSPIRPDPRPLHGILLAAHAFVPVAEFYRRCEAVEHHFTRDPGFKGRFKQIVEKNSEAINVLEKEGETTERGRVVMEQLSALNAEHRGYLEL